MRVLLVVDDSEDVDVLFRRFLKTAFDEIHVAHTVEAAEAVLSSRPVTHLVADNLLGPSVPSGASLLSGWRSRFPGVAFAALLTGDVNAREAPGIDAVFQKPRGFMELMEQLRAGLGRRT